MSAAPLKLTKMQFERQISIRKDRRTTFNEAMNPFLRQSPLIILPDINICKIPKTSLYKSENYIASLKQCSLIQKELVKSEATSNATKNMEFTSNTEEDVPKNESTKARFFSELNLVRRTTPRQAFVVNESELPPEWCTKLRERRNQVWSFLKDDSSSSGFSTTLLAEGSFPSLCVQVARCDSFYWPENLLDQAEDEIVKLTGTILAPAVKRVSKHRQSFCGTHQRAKKMNDGPSADASLKGSSLLKCRDFSIEVPKMTDHEIAEAMQSIQNAQLKHTKKAARTTSRLAQNWVASEPKAGPSGDFEIVAEPVVRLDDFRAC